MAEINNGGPALTKAQSAMLAKISQAGEYTPFGPEWAVFYRLKARGLALYTPNMRSAVLTNAGRSMLKQRETSNAE